MGEEGEFLAVWAWQAGGEGGSSGKKNIGHEAQQQVPEMQSTLHAGMYGSGVLVCTHEVCANFYSPATGLVPRQIRNAFFRACCSLQSAMGQYACERFNIVTALRYFRADIRGQRLSALLALADRGKHRWLSKSSLHSISLGWSFYPW